MVFVYSLRIVILALAAALAAVAGPGDFVVQVSDPAAWRPVLSAIGVEPVGGDARVRIVVGDEPAALEAGVVRRDDTVRIASLVDSNDPRQSIYWKEPVDGARFDLPPGATVYTRDKRSGAPLVAALPSERPTLWAAGPPGASGYEHFPFLLQALSERGLRAPFRGDRVWAFFDSSYRLRADPDYLARRWREAGIAALHVAAWHFYDGDAEKDAYLDRLLAACRRHGVLVYAWLEFPHVSEGFWERRPECREKTAVLQDAKLDWRKLINLANADCAADVAAGLRRLLTRFEWDGVNLAELYFESLHGPSNPARLTPLNDDVRREAAESLGFDPIELFEEDGAHHWSRDTEAWIEFADYRAALVIRLHRKWLSLIREVAPQADLVVTQIEDRFDDRMREYLGADAAALLALAEEYDFTLLIEDPATLWSLGPERYTQIAERYLPLTADPARLAIDINIVERYQQTYPTRKQVGVEFLQLLDRATRAFPRTAVYFESSIAKPDWPLMPAAVSGARLAEREGTTIVVEADRPFGVSWSGFARVNEEPWPVTDGETVWLPAGRHRVSAAAAPPPGRVKRLNADLLGASCADGRVVIRYRAKSTALALLDRKPREMRLNGETVEPDLVPAKRHWSLRLPRGEHEASLFF